MEGQRTGRMVQTLRASSAILRWSPMISPRWCSLSTVLRCSSRTGTSSCCTGPSLAQSRASRSRRSGWPLRADRRPNRCSAQAERWRTWNRSRWSVFRNGFRTPWIGHASLGRWSCCSASSGNCSPAKRTHSRRPDEWTCISGSNSSSPSPGCSSFRGGECD